MRARDAAGHTSAAAQLTVSTAACSTTPPPTTDTISPSTPTGLAASNIAQTGLALNWNASSDNVGVTGYDVYRNGARVASVTSTTVNQSTLSCGTSYPFAVRALDGAGRTSAAAQLTVSTAACSTTPPPDRHDAAIDADRTWNLGRDTDERLAHVEPIDRQRRCGRLPAVCQWILERHHDAARYHGVQPQLRDRIHLRR